MLPEAAIQYKSNPERRIFWRVLFFNEKLIISGLSWKAAFTMKVALHVPVKARKD